MTARPWGVEEMALLVEKSKQGLSRKELISYFPDRSYYAVNEKALRLSYLTSSPQMRGRRFSDDDIHRIIDMRVKEARTIPEIALELDRNVDEIHRVW